MTVDQVQEAEDHQPLVVVLQHLLVVELLLVLLVVEVDHDHEVAHDVVACSAVAVEGHTVDVALDTDDIDTEDNTDEQHLVDRVVPVVDVHTPQVLHMEVGPLVVVGPRGAFPGVEYAVANDVEDVVEQR